MTATRPNQNKNGQAKKPSANPDGGAKPSVPQVSAANPMTHPGHPLVQQQQNVSTVTPEAPGGNPTGDPKGNIVPTPTSDVRQVRENINFHDLSPAGQMQAQEQQGLDPMMPMKMMQQAATGAAGQGPSSGPVPNTLMGPFIPPGVENFPDDMAHLTTLMQQGLGPGAHPSERAMALNAHALASAKLAAAAAQNGPSSPIAHPGMPQIEPPNPMQGPPPGAVPPPGPGAMAPPPGPPPSPDPTTLSGSPSAPPAQPPQDPNQPPAGPADTGPAPAPAPAPAPLPETQPPAAIPPSALAGLLAKHLKKKGA